jgi:phosphatidylserine/phosphatidylglycerophosphate/cardiolipin synthase-like enzyme
MPNLASNPEHKRGHSPLKLLLQPGDGIERLIKGINKARKSVEIVIFRFDRSEIERALVEAVERGVFVHALIAFTNRGGEEHLRKLEQHFLASGMTVARTAGDLVRYHGKMMLIDRRDLYLLSFNFTHMDIDHSRSFGLITRNPKLVQEAGKLFDADTKRQDYTPGYSKFVVSPANSRKELAKFIKGAKQDLLIYDPKISDRAMLRLLEERQNAGVDVRVIGKVAGSRLSSREMPHLRLHTRTILRDGKQAFVGSQSMRQLELDARREIGIIFRDPPTIKTLIRTFEEDWAASQPPKTRKLAVGKTARKVAKTVSKKLAVAPVVKDVARAIRKKTNGKVGQKVVEEAVEAVMEDAMRDTIKEATKHAVKAVAEEVEGMEKVDAE